jgi:hypothetical protein
VAEHYLADGGIELASPPLRALLHIMRGEPYEGKDLQHPEIRALFTPEHFQASDWYIARLKAKQQIDLQLWERHMRYLEEFLARSNYADEAERLGLRARLKLARRTLSKARQKNYWQGLMGTLGADPAILPPKSAPRRAARTRSLQGQRRQLVRHGR